MKKNINIPEIKIVRFDSRDVIATSGPNSVSYGGGNGNGGPTVAETQGRSGLWD